MGAAQNTENAGHASAEELFRQHAPFVARFLFRLGVRPDGIEDAVQEVFLVVHRQGGYRPGAAKPTSYLANLAVHAAAAYRRRERARGAREADTAVEDVASTRSDPVEVLETNESLRRLQDVLDRLEPDLRTTLVLVEIEGETCASIAATMGIPVGTVYWRLHQARKKFQRILQTMEAAVPHRELAAQVAGLASGLRPERKERTGMVLLMTPHSWMDSAARDLLRLGATRPAVKYTVQPGLERHLQLVGSGTPPPSWAEGLGAAAKSAAWTTAAVTVAAVGAVAAAVVLVARAGVQAPSSPASPITNVAPMRTPSAAAPSASASLTLATPESQPAGSSIPVELLPPAAAPTAPVVATHGTGSGVPPRAEVQADMPHVSSASPTDELLELQQVAKAERLLTTDPGGALTLVRAAEARFPNGYVREERAYVELMALLAMGRLDEARPKIARFLREYPESTFSRRVREATPRALLDP